MLYIFLFFFVFLIVHILYFPILLFFIEAKFLLAIAHDFELLFLKYFHPADFEGPATQYIEKWLNFIVKVEELIVPDLGFAI